MKDANGPASDRRSAIASSGARIIARDGLRALTHRAVDRETGIPEGSTSHLARTRRALLELIVEGLEGRTAVDARQFSEVLASRTSLSVDELAALLSEFIESLATRSTDMRARYALLIEIGDDHVLRQKLGVGSELQVETRRIVTLALDLAGLDSSDTAADELIALTDSLLFHRTVLGDAASVGTILGSYLHGQRRVRIVDGGRP